MRKYLLLLIAFFACWQFNANAQNCSVAQTNISENFNSTIGSSLPACWAAPGGSVTSYSDSPTNPNRAIKMSSFSSQKRYLVLPKVRRANGTLSFTLRKLNSQGGSGSIEVGVMSTSSNTASFTPIYSTSIQYASTQSRTVSFNNYNGTGQYIAIRSNSPSVDAQAVFMIDNVNYSEFTTIADTLFVDKDATGANDGSSWANAFTDLQSALATTTSFNRNEEIWIAEGTYTPHASDRSMSFEFPQKTKLYGGFAGGETIRDQRNPALNKVILSGDLLGNDNNNIIHSEPTRQDNAYNVIKFTNNSKDNVYLEGITISSGNANGSTTAQASGAAILMHHNFTTKRYGITLNDVIIENNAAIRSAVYRYIPRTVGSGQQNNSYSKMIARNAIVRNNHSQDEANFYMYTNAQAFETSHVEFSNSLFHDNVSVNQESIVFCRSNYNASAGHFRAYNCTFANNTGENGRAIYLHRADNSRFWNSIVWGVGGPSPVRIVTNSNTPKFWRTLLEGTATGATNSDPLFADAANNDFRLNPISPAINFGINNSLPASFTEDLAGNPRIYAGVIDCGAFEAQNACIRPTGLQVLNNAGTSVTIGWDAIADATSFDLLYVLSGQPIANGTIISNLTTNSGGISGLTPSTDYDVYVRTTCGAQGTTDWSAPFTFTTLEGPIYVDKDATGANDGSSWANAFTKLEDALPLATATNQIWVAEGVYLPGTARTSTFSVLTQTKLYGGFDGSETNFSDRDVANNITILSGDVNGDDNNNIIDTEPTRQENVYHIVSVRGNTRNIVIDGFTISGGNANGNNDVSCSTPAANQYYHQRGAAIYANPYSGSHLTMLKVQNCILENNSAVRTVVAAAFSPCGVTNAKSDMDFLNCIARNNYSDQESAFIFSAAGGYGIIHRGSLVNCLIVNNESNTGAAGLFLSTSTASGGNANALNFDMVNCTFANNTSGNTGKVIRFNRASTARIRNVIIHGNGGTAPFIVVSTGPSFTSSIVEGGQYGGSNVDPLFIDAANGNFTPSCASPAIDAATASSLIPSVDINGNPRNNNGVDIGAIEFQGQVTSTTTNAAATVCSGDSYTFVDGSTVNNITADFIDTSSTVSSLGCDSTVITAINVVPSYNASNTATVCAGGNFTFADGSTQNNLQSDVTYTSNLQTVAGCDSLITETVTVNPVYNLTESASICAGDNYIFPDGTTQNNLQADVTYTSTLQASTGCDSTIITTVIVNPVYNATQNVTVCSGASYTFPDGSTQNNILANTSQTSTLQSAANCDSVVVTNINVTTSYTIPVTAAACFGDSYTFPDGTSQTITSQVVQTSTLQSSIGCDSNIVTTVMMNQVYNSAMSASICEGSSYTFPDGTTQNNLQADVTYVSNLQTVAGCDSNITVILTVNPVYSQTAAGSVCAGDSYTFPDGTTQNNLQANVTYTSNLQTTNGCDSTITTTVTVNPVYNSTQNVTVCSGASYTFPDGSTQSNILANTSQTSTLQSAANCDSVIVTNISITTSYTIPVAATICAGDSYTFPDGTTQNNLQADVTYTSTLQSSIGCDSNIVTTVAINPTYNSITTATICAGDSYTFPDGTTQNNLQADVSYISVLQTALGCDSAIATNVKVNPTYNSTEIIDICDGGNYTFPDGTAATNVQANVTHLSNLQTAEGCDSIISTTLVVQPNYNSSESVAVCSGGSYTFPDGTTQANILSPMTYTSNMQSAYGCDSVIVTNISINATYNVASSATICAGDSYTFADGTTQNNITIQVVYVSNLQSSIGCDSMITTTVDVLPTYSALTLETLCSGSDYTFPDGTTQMNITAAVNQVSNLQTVDGCDSIITTQISVLPAYNLSESASVCIGDSYTFPDGTTQTNLQADVTYTSNLQTEQGCDSVIVTSVTVNSVSNTSESVTVCAGDSYTFPDGTTQTNLQADVTYTSNLQSAQGCDSVVVTSVTVNSVSNTSESVTVCAGDDYTFPDGTTQTNLQADVTYTSNLQSAQGCDSVVTTTVNVQTVDQTITFQNGILTPVQTGVSYQWLDCNDNNAPIAGANAQTYTPTVDGSYAVEIDQGGCVAIVGCINVTLTGIFNNTIDVNIYPNPVADYLSINSDANIELLNIYNANGALVKTIEGDVQQIDVSELAQGNYFIEVQIDGAIGKAQFIKY